MLQGEHSAILLTFFKLPFDIKIFVLSIFEWPFQTGFTVLTKNIQKERSGPDVKKIMLNSTEHEILIADAI